MVNVRIWTRRLAIMAGVFSRFWVPAHQCFSTARRGGSWHAKIFVKEFCCSQFYFEYDNGVNKIAYLWSICRVKLVRYKLYVKNIFSACSVRDRGMRGKKFEKHCSRPLVCKQEIDDYISRNLEIRLDHAVWTLLMSPHRLINWGLHVCYCSQLWVSQQVMTFITARYSISLKNLFIIYVDSMLQLSVIHYRKFLPRQSRHLPGHTVTGSVLKDTLKDISCRYQISHWQI